MEEIEHTPTKGSQMPSKIHTLSSEEHELQESATVTVPSAIQNSQLVQNIHQPQPKKYTEIKGETAELSELQIANYKAATVKQESGQQILQAQPKEAMNSQQVLQAVKLQLTQQILRGMQEQLAQQEQLVQQAEQHARIVEHTQQLDQERQVQNTNKLHPEIQSTHEHDLGVAAHSVARLGERC